MAYLLDTNVFIQAQHHGYALDVCPGFWRWIEAAHLEGRVTSIQPVLDELRAREDELSDWAERQKKSFFAPLDAKSVQEIGTLSTWAEGQVRTGRYRRAAIEEFMESTDLQLVAHALAHGHVVVTLERASNELTRVKIPNACSEHRVSFINTLGMLRREKVRFVLA